jgi:hypothetical protein
VITADGDGVALVLDLRTVYAVRNEASYCLIRCPNTKPADRLRLRCDTAMGGKVMEVVGGEGRYYELQVTYRLKYKIINHFM